MGRRFPTQSISRTTKAIKINFDGYKKGISTKLLPINYAEADYGFSHREGILTADLEVVSAMASTGNITNYQFTLPKFTDGTVILSVHLYKKTTDDGEIDDRLVAISTTGKVYMTKINFIDTWHEIGTIKTSSDKITGYSISYNYNSKDVMLYASEKTPLVIVEDETVTICNNGPKVTSLCEHYERIYCTLAGSKNAVWFSDDFDPTNWNVSSTEGGFINFGNECGDVLKVISFLDYVYIFFEQGIYKLTAYADQNDFTLTKVHCMSEKIQYKTITQGGDAIYFMTQTGIFRFDGYDVTLLTIDLPTIISPELAFMVYLNEKLYIACCTIMIRRTDISYNINNSIVEYDLRNKMVCTLGKIYVKYLMAINHRAQSKLYFLVSRLLDQGSIYMLETQKDGFGSIMDEVTPKLYQTVTNDMGTSRLKVAKELQIYTARPITFGVIADGVETTYEIPGIRRVQKIPLNARGVEMGFFIKSSAYGIVVIYPPTVIIDLI